METIHEFKMESPVMVTAGRQRAIFHTRNLPNTGKPMTPISPLSPSDSSASYSPTTSSVARKPSQIMRGWVKRSASSSDHTEKSASTFSTPGHQRLPIVHLGGGRVGESDIEPTIPTGLRPATRKPSTERANSADSRVTQWIDLYPEAIERITSTKQVRQQQGSHTRSFSSTHARWKLQPEHHAAAPPERDARPAPLRIPSAKLKPEEEAKEGPSKTSLTRSDSKWKPLPVLPVQQQVQAVPALVNKSVGNGIPARKPLQQPAEMPEKGFKESGRPKTPPRRTTSLDSQAKPTPVPLPPLTIYVTPPPTPDTETGSPTTEPTPKLVSGPPALRINTGKPPTPTGTPTGAPTTLPVQENDLTVSLASPTTLNGSHLSSDMDDAIKITIGMMCMDDTRQAAQSSQQRHDAPPAYTRSSSAPAVTSTPFPSPIPLPLSVSSPTTGATFAGNVIPIPNTATATAADGRSDNSTGPSTTATKPNTNKVTSPISPSPITSPSSLCSPSSVLSQSRSRYTREERMWLHQHYRGEAPFLRAWGLDIKSAADREEGVVILRDLIEMDLDGDVGESGVEEGAVAGV